MSIVKKQLQLVLLPTKDNSYLCLKDNKLVNANDGGSMLGYDPPRWFTQHLYAISNEKPKIGDYTIINNILGKVEYDTTSETWDLISLNGNTYPFTTNKYFKKVVITTDKSLTYCQCGNNPHKMSCKQTYNFPTFTNDFINTYVERYNNDEIIETVGVRYDVYDFMPQFGGRLEKLPINSNNTIEVSLIENDCICRICNNIAIISKGIINIHDIRTSDHTKEFITKVIDCYKCNNCGHSRIPLEGLDKEDKLYTKEEVVTNLDKFLIDYEQFKKDSYYGPNQREIKEWSNNWIKNNL